MTKCPVCGWCTNRKTLTRIEFRLIQKLVIVSRLPLCAKCHLGNKQWQDKHPQHFEETLLRHHPWQASLIYEKEKKA